MSKSNIFFGQPIFSQMISLLNKGKITTRAVSHKSDHYCKRFSTFQRMPPSNCILINWIRLLGHYYFD